MKITRKMTRGLPVRDQIIVNPRLIGDLPLIKTSGKSNAMFYSDVGENRHSAIRNVGLDFSFYKKIINRIYHLR